MSRSTRPTEPSTPAPLFSEPTPTETGGPPPQAVPPAAPPAPDVPPPPPPATPDPHGTPVAPPAPVVPPAVKQRAERDTNLISASLNQQIQQQKAMAAMAAEIAGETWGAKMTPALREAFALYLTENALDISEVDPLGGNPYRNSRYYLRRLSELEEAGDVAEFRYQYVHVLPEVDGYIADAYERLSDADTLPELVPDLRQYALDLERSVLQGRALRATHAIPDDALAACVVWIRLKESPVTYTDAKWIVRDKKKKKAVWQNGKNTGTFEDVNADPVGQEYPVETVLSRALRRTLRMVCNQFPRLAAIEQRLDDGAKALQIAYTHEMAKVRPDRGLEVAPEVLALSAGTPIKEMKFGANGQPIEVIVGAMEPGTHRVKHGRGTPEPPDAKAGAWKVRGFEPGEYGG